MVTTKDRHDRWDPKMTYVIGHRRPDTDAIASALGYAWYLREIGQENIMAARAGQPGEQAMFALKRFELQPPLLLTGVAPTFGHAAKPQPSVSPNDPLPAAMARVAEGDRVIPVVDEQGKPSGVVTSLALARAYTAPMNVTLMLAQPCQSIAETPVAFAERDRISDHRNALLRSETDDFLVVTETGQYVGVATRRVILEPPRARLILVDHNELSQAIADADEAEIIAVLDHHRLGNAPTAIPIPFVVEPVGSTCTLVAEHCQVHRLEPPAALAGMMLSGILSDTLVFRSPTATERDRQAAGWLAEWAHVDALQYGEELLRASPGLAARSAEDILDTDRKSYQMGEYTVSIGQVEVTSLAELPEHRAALLAALQERRERENLALIGLMVTDVVMGRSRMLCQGDPWILTALPFTHITDTEFDLEDMVSRKKQLVPVLMAVLEEPR
ncbi:MAG TPA: DHHA2 domain-containing protein [Chthonomonadaceae bacterium]|nr:DHHA2 domain-containing protein [Chthonomonadaceae bacterium]